MWTGKQYEFFNRLVNFIVGKNNDAKFFLIPNLFAICKNTYSKWWEELRMYFRRVLSSTPLLVRGSETVWDSGERELTN
jgi:hypothetical protein